MTEGSASIALHTVRRWFPGCIRKRERGREEGKEINKDKRKTKEREISKQAVKKQERRKDKEYNEEVRRQNSGMEESVQLLFLLSGCVVNQLLSGAGDLHWNLLLIELSEGKMKR